MKKTKKNKKTIFSFFLNIIKKEKIIIIKNNKYLKMTEVYIDSIKGESVNI